MESESVVHGDNFFKVVNVQLDIEKYNGVKLTSLTSGVSRIVYEQYGWREAKKDAPLLVFYNKDAALSYAMVAYRAFAEHGVRFASVYRVEYYGLARPCGFVLSSVQQGWQEHIKAFWKERDARKFKDSTVSVAPYGSYSFSGMMRLTERIARV